MTLRSLFLSLRPLENLVVVFYSAIIIAMLAVNASIPLWYVFILVDILIIAGLLYLGTAGKTSNSRVTRIIQYWYPAPLILLTFKQIYFLIKPLRGELDYDTILINTDKLIFGFNPTEALFQIANPVLTELLQIAYASFYILPIVLAFALYLQKRHEAVEYVVFLTVYGFFISYLGYFLLPAVGPRFTLHDFSQNDAQLPGLLLTQFLRFVVNTGESIPPGTIDPVSHVQRDVFPSGHTMMTAMIMYLSVIYKSNTRFFILITGTFLIFATVYLRYHYVTDVIAGLLFMVFALWSGKMYFNKVKKNADLIRKPLR
ncbi:MAG: phosphatase PAP2 family protein [Ignavibacteriales bacterium]|nr:phosphatase PAP2 family protein [Ignavibacteriales bacterium]